MSDLVDNSRPGQLRRWAEKREARELPAHLLRDAADEIESLRARLSAAETERDAYRRAKAENDERFQLAAQHAEIRADAAEARVEALSEALDEILLDGAPGKPLTPIQVRVIARAALACPPQQPEKAGE